MYGILYINVTVWAVSELQGSLYCASNICTIWPWCQRIIKSSGRILVKAFDCHFEPGMILFHPLFTHTTSRVDFEGSSGRE